MNITSKCTYDMQILCEYNIAVVLIYNGAVILKNSNKLTMQMNNLAKYYMKRNRNAVEGYASITSILNNFN